MQDVHELLLAMCTHLNDELGKGTWYIHYYIRVAILLIMIVCVRTSSLEEGMNVSIMTEGYYTVFIKQNA